MNHSEKDLWPFAPRSRSAVSFRPAPATPRRGLGTHHFCSRRLRPSRAAMKMSPVRGVRARLSTCRFTQPREPEPEAPRCSGSRAARAREPATEQSPGTPSKSDNRLAPGSFGVMRRFGANRALHRHPALWTRPSAQGPRPILGTKTLRPRAAHRASSLLYGMSLGRASVHTERLWFTSARRN